jgi:hypothetical protein
MNSIIPNRTLWLRWVAAAQMLVALCHVGLLFPLLAAAQCAFPTSGFIREATLVHGLFVLLATMTSAALTWRFAHDLVAGAAPMNRWLGGAIALFWASRSLLQLYYYLTTHWQAAQLHLIGALVYGGFGAVYLAAACRSANAGDASHEY